MRICEFIKNSGFPAKTDVCVTDTSEKLIKRAVGVYDFEREAVQDFLIFFTIFDCILGSVSFCT